jgi:hypothetical protein
LPIFTLFGVATHAAPEQIMLLSCCSLAADDIVEDAAPWPPHFPDRYLDRVVFLDVDGVLHAENGHSAGQLFKADCMQRLQHLVERSQAAIILSTSWRGTQRGIDQINEALAQRGIPGAAGITPLEGYPSRADEILAWLEAHPTVTRFVALDDMDLTADITHAPRSRRALDTSPFALHCVRTSKDTGLSDADVAESLGILQNRRTPPRGDPGWPKARRDPWSKPGIR